MKHVVLMTLVACGGGGGGNGNPADAAVDSPPPAVQALSACPSSVAATVIDSPSTFVPKATTITVGGVVKFEITAEHFVIPNISVMTDPAFNIGRNETKCLRFNATGTWGFACGVHGFAGTITVQ